MRSPAESDVYLVNGIGLLKLEPKLQVNRQKREVQMTKITQTRKTRVHLLVVLIVVIFCCALQAYSTEAATKAKTTKTKTYTVKTSSKPYGNQYVKSATYNKKTKHYYMLRSYLEQLEKEGGGTLVLKKGTYNITNVLYVPSNVTIKLSNGVKLSKSMETGTKKLKASKTMFQLVAPSLASKKEACASYKGSKNVSIIGTGNVRIDMKYEANVVGIVIGHNKTVTIQGITFQNMNGGNFIQIAASKSITIQGNIFKNHKDTASNNKEAIRLAVADAKTKNFSYKWSKKDNTINQNIYIKNNQFKKLERAIGSTKYVDKSYHTNVRITGNNISTIDSDAIRVLNWSKPKILQNTITNVAGGINGKRAILISGGVDPIIKDNTFVKVSRSIQILPAKNSGAGSDYPTTYNSISYSNRGEMLQNTVQELEKYYVIYNKTYKEYSKNTSRWYYIDTTTKDYSIVEGAPTYREYFTDFSTYNVYTKDFYVFRSYLEQLERVGGGTLTIKKGTYTITNTLYIPSNVTIYMEDGVVINKGTKTELKTLPPAYSIFQMVTPSSSLTNATVGGYDGGHDINIIGSGTVLMDMKFHSESLGFVLGHNKNITIKGITFENMYGAHFIELNSSQNVTIEGCTFRHHYDTDNNNKEAINIDNPDAETKGFNQIWAVQDRTPVQDVYIKNNTFTDLERAIGTHKYTENVYHKNVQILNNTITDCDKDPIRVLNWESPIIYGNTIGNIESGLGSLRAVLMSGAIYPSITNNTFQFVERPIEIKPWKNTNYGANYAPTGNNVPPEYLNAMLNNTFVQVGKVAITITDEYVEDGLDSTKRYIYLK